MEIKNKADLFTYLEELETKLSKMQETLDTKKPDETPDETPDDDKKDGEKTDGETDELTDDELNDLDKFFEEE